MENKIETTIGRTRSQDLDRGRGYRPDKHYVAVKELNLSCYSGDTTLSTIYTHVITLNPVSYMSI